MNETCPRALRFAWVYLSVFILAAGMAQAADKTPFSAADVLQLKTCTAAAISPNGEWISYTVSVNRAADDEPGAAYSELHLMSVRTGQNRPYVTGKVNASSPRWSPDGAGIAFLSKRGDAATTQVWLIPLAGGEAFPLTQSATDVLAFRWHPAGNKIAYVALPPAGPREKELLKKGFGFIFFEEDWKPRNLYLTDVRKGTPPGPAEQLSQGLTVWDFEFSPDGRAIAAACSPHNLVDDEYMFKKIYLMDLQSKTCTLLIDPQSKLGNLAFSPDGTKLAYAAARARNDHAVSQAYVLELKKAQTRNLTPADFAGHATWVGWADNQSLLFLAAEGVWNTLNRLPLRNPKREILLDSRKTGTIFGAPEQAADSRQTSLIANSPDSPGDLFSWTPPAPPHRLTTLNPWIAERRLGKQEVFRYRARDGQELEGILVYPIAAAAGRTYPLIVSVHGGPESNQSNGWLTGTNHPAQVLAGKGYLAFYPNYRASTGYGVAFAMAGYEDPAGKEFDDIADGIDALVQRGLADRERVGLGGGSYGGYAAAWFASYYTRYVRAVVMFVGISDLISKRGTTDIPYEELYVHSGKKLEEMWDLALKRSPIYWAKQSRSAVLIMGGTSDTRVDPGQSKEFYRQLKMNNHPAVRLVQYPGEGHGNRKQPGRIDMLYRHLQWYDWYVRDRQPLDGPLPPLDISDCYGIKLPN